MEWQLIETCPIKPFDKDKWFMPHSERVLVFDRYPLVAAYNFTKRGKGKWVSGMGSVKPTHWMPLPSPPKAVE